MNRSRPSPAAYRLALLAYAALIAGLSLRPMGTGSLEPWDKLLHALAYGAFALLAWRAATGARQYTWLCLLIVLYGGLMEVGQGFIPGRMMSLGDLLANTVGVLLGALLARRLLPADHRSS